MSNIEILSLLGIRVPDIIDWPVDILSMCEMADILGISAGMIYWDALIDNRISFSGFLSKGKPPERRDKCILFELKKFKPYFITTSGYLYEVVSTEGRYLLSANEIGIALPMEDIAETVPAVCTYKSSPIGI